MVRVVIDTNCFLAIIPKVSPYRPVFDAYRAGRFELAVSTEILDEYAEIFSRKMTPEIATNLLELILKQFNTHKTEIFFRWAIITEDYDDNKFVDAAISAGADYSISHDSHYKVLKELPFPRVSVINLRDFMESLKSV